LIRARKVKGIFFASLKRTLEGERFKTTENQSAFGVLYFFMPSCSLKQASFAHGHKKNQRKTLVFSCFGGERGF
jgi:hypothetical protein